MQTYVALLRGINVGGKNLIKMAELKAMLLDLGLGDPKTLLQSGNVVFQSDLAASELEAKLEQATAQRFSAKPSYVVRDEDEWARIIDNNPFPAVAQSDPGHLLVHFFKEKVSPDVAVEVAGRIRGPEKVVAIGREMYVTYPDGIGRSTIVKTPGWNRLAATGTARNWNTVLKLAALCG